MKALIDFDSYCFASAVRAEGQSAQVAKWNLNAMLESTLRELNTQDFQTYITGPDNFRYSIYPEYKANRSSVRPEHLKATKEHAQTEWGAIKSVGCEADDLLGIDQCAALSDEETIIVSIDKDLNMIPGWHYNPIKKERYLVSPLDAIRFFYYQLLVGDSADNIKGAKGIGKVKAEAALVGISEEAELFRCVSDYYSCYEELEMNARCLWIWRKENDDVRERLAAFRDDTTE